MLHLLSFNEHLVFVYGTLKNKKLLKKVIGHNVPVTKAETTGEVEDIKGYPNLIPNKKDNVVKGKLLTINDDELKTLDNWEEKYNRKKVKLSNNKIANYYRLKNE